jgi:hypothetical protein
MSTSSDVSRVGSGNGNRRWQFGIGTLLLLTLNCAMFFALIRIDGLLLAILFEIVIVAAGLFVCGLLRVNAKLILLALVVMLGPVAWLSIGALWYAQHHFGEGSQNRMIEPSLGSRTEKVDTGKRKPRSGVRG